MIKEITKLIWSMSVIILSILITVGLWIYMDNNDPWKDQYQQKIQQQQEQGYWS